MRAQLQFAKAATATGAQQDRGSNSGEEPPFDFASDWGQQPARHRNRLHHSSIGALERRIVGLEMQLVRMEDENADLAARLASASATASDYSRRSEQASSQQQEQEVLKLQLQRLEAEVQRLRGGSNGSTAAPHTAAAAPSPQAARKPQAVSSVARQAEHRAVIDAAEAALRRLEEPRSLEDSSEDSAGYHGNLGWKSNGPVSAGGYVLEERLAPNSRGNLLLQRVSGSSPDFGGSAAARLQAPRPQQDELLLVVSPRRKEIPPPSPPPPPTPPLPPPPPPPQRQEDREISERVRNFLARLPALGESNRRQLRSPLGDDEDEDEGGEGGRGYGSRGGGVTFQEEVPDYFDDDTEDDLDDVEATAPRPPSRGGLLGRLRAQAALRLRQEAAAMKLQPPPQASASSASSAAAAAAVDTTDVEEEFVPARAVAQVRQKFRESSAEALYGGGGAAAAAAAAGKAAVPPLNLEFVSEQQSRKQQTQLDLSPSARRYADQLVAKYLSSLSEAQTASAY